MREAVGSRLENIVARVGQEKADSRLPVVESA